MKKFLSLSVIIALSALAYAGEKNITLTSGHNYMFQDASKTALFVFDYDDCYGGEISKGVLKEGALPLEEYLAARGDDSLKDWPGLQEFAYERFFKNWNVMNRKRMRLASATDTPDYLITFHVKGIDFGSTAAALFGVGKAGGIILIGDIDVVNMATNETVATYKVHQIKGQGDIGEAMRMWVVYNQFLGEFTRFNLKVQ